MMNSYASFLLSTFSISVFSFSAFPSRPPNPPSPPIDEPANFLMQIKGEMVESGLAWERRKIALHWRHAVRLQVARDRHHGDALRRKHRNRPQYMQRRRHQDHLAPALLRAQLLEAQRLVMRVRTQAEVGHRH